MNASAEALWLRALDAVQARGLLPTNRALFTPAELAAEAALRGEERLMRLVAAWYYPASYGRRTGTLSEADVEELVAALEAERGFAPVAEAEEPAAPELPPLPEERGALRLALCDLCAAPLPPTDEEEA
ncbi:MAG: hypothetical protein JOZ24_01755 [Candidatus Eremiobacteraeota bacterium]|nr:hypothetical protein [Candidatus Eremiobacteraeota bacterium]